MNPRPSVAETLEQMLAGQLPNLFRLYLNPHVTQTCLCLARYVQTTWVPRPEDRGDPQTFLANSFDEALSGAIKLARYCSSVAGRPAAGLLVDHAGRLGPFVETRLAGGERVELLPGLVTAGREALAGAISGQRFGFVVLVSADARLHGQAEEVRRLVERDACLVVRCVDRAGLAAIRRGAPAFLRGLAPDVVVFDESFVNGDVPFGAFTARKPLYDHWNRPGKATFHSTTYQPNTISSLHFLRCLEHADPEFYAGLAEDLGRIEASLHERGTQFRRLYSASLYRAIRATGCETADVRAAGDFVHVDGRAIYDGVSGVACSVRGHNPPGYTEELAALGDGDSCRQELTDRVRALTGLGHLLPAVSGASGVETALKVALAAQHPRRHVLALKAGFGGKTLLALTGTWNATYKEHLEPLHGEVTYVDPFAPDAIAQIDAVLERYPAAVAQVELIQGVGGVRRVPEEVVRHLAERRRRHGHLLLVDEVQTGMYRTGPFTRSAALGLAPDLVVLGKGTSDMMFPFSLVLYSSAVREKLERAGSDLAEVLCRRHDYPTGYRTVLNVLRRAEELGLAERVASSGALFARLLDRELASCAAVREVRVFGLLIGIELRARGWLQRWLGKRLFWPYLLGMLRHPRFPVLVGFCQYEPNVLKITPSLASDPADIEKACATIGEVLSKPFHRLLGPVLGSLVSPLYPWRRKHERAVATAREPGTR